MIQSLETAKGEIQASNDTTKTELENTKKRIAAAEANLKTTEQGRGVLIAYLRKH